MLKNIKYMIMTLGCKVNTADSEELDAALRSRGAVETDQDPDICFLFSCTVTGRADSKSRRAVRSIYKKHNQPLIVLMGCMANSIDEKTLSELPVVFKFSPSEPVGKLIQRLESLVETADDGPEGLNRSAALSDKGVQELFAPASGRDRSGAVKTGRTRAVVKVQTGCISFCSYCIIPYVRGPVKSVDPDLVIELIHDLEKRGYREIVLTGINIGCYGLDKGKKDFPGLLEKILSETSVPRIRISSIEPLDVDDRLLDVLTGTERICRHLHLPMQSGSRNILKAMRRPYTPEEYLEVVSRARKRLPELNITSDIIAGFPGETPEDHQESLDMIAKAGITKVHAFPFSRRKGTKAYDMKPVVPGNISSERVRELMQAGEKNFTEYVKSSLNRTRQVLLEQRDKENCWTGFTGDYLRTVISMSEDSKYVSDYSHNEIVKVKITGTKGAESVTACPAESQD
jgi:threonylcarbamoyladenosine tRNA methylthiotransferase MtaB